MRQRVYSGAPREPIVGHARAVRAGSQVFVPGTAAVDERGAVVAPGDAGAQAAFALAKIGRALRRGVRGVPAGDDDGGSARAD